MHVCKARARVAAAERRQRGRLTGDIVTVIGRAKRASSDLPYFGAALLS
jgi:hypothetical protein